VKKDETTQDSIFSMGVFADNYTLSLSNLRQCPDNGNFACDILTANANNYMYAKIIPRLVINWGMLLMSKEERGHVLPEVNGEWSVVNNIWVRK
jgi:hypothetical protein